MIPTTSVNFAESQSSRTHPPMPIELKKSGRLWKYYGETSNSNGGTLYHFVLDPKYNHFAKYIPGSEQEMDLTTFKKIQENVRQAEKEMYPADELEWISLLPLNRGLSSVEYQKIITHFEKFSKMTINHSFESEDSDHQYRTPALRDLNTLGYDSGYNFDRSKVTLTLPGTKALLSNWKELQNNYPSLRELKIRSSDGMASDREFIRSFLNGEFVLSESTEFVHDHLIHLSTFLEEVLLDQHYPNRYELTTYEKLEILRAEVKRVFDILEDATESLSPDQKSKFDPLYFVLSLNLDVITGNSPYAYAHQLPVFPGGPGLELLREKFGQDFSEMDFNSLFYHACELSHIAKKRKSDTSHEEQNPKRVKYADSTLRFIVEDANRG